MRGVFVGYIDLLVTRTNFNKKYNNVNIYQNVKLVGYI